jgi:hypothetical protein
LGLILDLNQNIIKGLFSKIDSNGRCIISFKNLEDFIASNTTGKDYTLEFMEELLEAHDGYISLY